MGRFKTVIFYYWAFAVICIFLVAFYQLVRTGFSLKFLLTIVCGLAGIYFLKLFKQEQSKNENLNS
jgi:glucose uptake protein GlcU